MWTLATIAADDKNMLTSFSETVKNAGEAKASKSVASAQGEASSATGSTRTLTVMDLLDLQHSGKCLTILRIRMLRREDMMMHP